MYCTNCGAELPQGAGQCLACRQIVARPPTHSPGRSNHQVLLAFSIAATLVCCMPAGVVAIVYSSLAMARAVIDPTNASRNARIAKRWLWVSVGIGLVVNGLYIAAAIFSSDFP